MTVDTAGLSGSNTSHLVLDPSHHMVTLNSNDALASISLGVITRSLAEQGYIDAHVYTDVHLLPEVVASLTADFAVFFPSDVSSIVPEGNVSTTPNDANASITFVGDAAGAQFTTAGAIELIAVALDGTVHKYDLNFQGDAGIIDFEFVAPNGTSDTSLAWGADFLKLHTDSSIMFA